MCRRNLSVIESTSGCLYHSSMMRIVASSSTAGVSDAECFWHLFCRRFTWSDFRFIFALRGYQEPEILAL